MTRKICIFGSSRPQPGEPSYQEAMKLGRLLAEAGYTVITGGNCGTMEAVSRGAAEQGAHVIGVTCDEIESWRPAGANDWVMEEWRASTIFERIEMMISNSDAAIALPGGIGTLTEIMVTWNQLSVEALSIPPILMVGPEWKAFFTPLFSNTKYISSEDFYFLQFFDDVDSAVRALVKNFELATNNKPFNV